MKVVENKVVAIRQIHETALVHPGAKLGKYVVIGPYAIIGEHVELGDGCVVGPNVVIDGWTMIGNNNKFYHGASIGVEPQDLKFKGEKSYLFIGDNNIFRESVTVSRGTEGAEEKPGSVIITCLWPIPMWPMTVRWAVMWSWPTVQPRRPCNGRRPGDDRRVVRDSPVYEGGQASDDRRLHQNRQRCAAFYYCRRKSGPGCRN